MVQNLFVNPATGNDSAAGSQTSPVKTITQALQLAQSGTTIQLLAGNYNATGGEVFPLTIPSGVKVVGNEAGKGNGIVIVGSGKFASRTFAEQNVTFVLANGAELRGVTIANPERRGTGVWIESTAPTVANCTLTKCKREGVFTTGDANPVIQGNVFTENDANGIAIAKNSRGQFQGNSCVKTGFGIAISDTASPTLIDNRISENRSGIVIGGSARPILRNNICENNSDDGITLIDNAAPDFGNNTSPGGNILRNNSKFDLRNASANKVVAVGNQINQQKVTGNVELVNNQSPTPTPTPTPLPTPTPTPLPTPTPTPLPTPTPTPLPTPTPTPLPTPTPTPLPTPTPTPLPTPTPTPLPTDLTDIGGHWAAEFIQELVTLGIISGFPDRSFKPNATMTRAQYAALLVKAFNPQAERAGIVFKDVAMNFWAFNAIQQAYRGEFLSGFPDGNFRPNQNIQRVQVIVSLVNGLGLSGGVDTALNAYSDRDSIPNYAKDEVTTATQRRLVVNHPNIRVFNPTRDATRAEVAAMVYQALVDARRAAPIDSPFIVGS